VQSLSVSKSHSFFVVQLQAACSAQEPWRRQAAGRRRTAITAPSGACWQRRSTCCSAQYPRTACLFLSLLPLL